jgi:hypothetical protein
VRKVEPRAGGTQTLGTEFDAAVGAVTIEDGSLELADQASGRTLVANGLSADIAWPSLSKALKATALLDAGGLAVKLDFSSPQPLLLFGGKDASVSATLDAAAFTASFDGVANLTDGLLRSGALTLGAKDIAALKAWSGIRLAGLDNLRQAQLSADLERVGEELRLDGLKFDVNDTHGTGILSLSRPADGKPRVSGTLAFDRLNITRLLSAFSLDLPSADEESEATERPPRLLQWLDFDLTLGDTRRPAAVRTGRRRRQHHGDRQDRAIRHRRRGLRRRRPDGELHRRRQRLCARRGPDAFDPQCRFCRRRRSPADRRAGGARQGLRRLLILRTTQPAWETGLSDMSAPSSSARPAAC